MSTFTLQYPAGGSYTASWLPSRDPAISGSDLEDDTGMIGELMADGATTYIYQIVPAHTKYKFSWTHLMSTDRTNFNSFVTTVGGLAFDLDSGTCGPVDGPVPVKLAPEAMSAEWGLNSGGTFNVTLTFIDSA